MGFDDDACSIKVASLLAALSRLTLKTIIDLHYKVIEGL